MSGELSVSTIQPAWDLQRRQNQKEGEFELFLLELGSSYYHQTSKFQNLKFSDCKTKPNAVPCGAQIFELGMKIPQFVYLILRLGRSGCDLDVPVRAEHSTVSYALINWGTLLMAS